MRPQFGAEFPSDDGDSYGAWCPVFTGSKGPPGCNSDPGWLANDAPSCHFALNCSGIRRDKKRGTTIQILRCRWADDIRVDGKASGQGVYFAEDFENDGIYAERECENGSIL